MPRTDRRDPSRCAGRTFTLRFAAVGLVFGLAAGCTSDPATAPEIGKEAGDPASLTDPSINPSIPEVSLPPPDRFTDVTRGTGDDDEADQFMDLVALDGYVDGSADHVLSVELPTGQVTAYRWRSEVDGRPVEDCVGTFGPDATGWECTEADAPAPADRLELQRRDIGPFSVMLVKNVPDGSIAVDAVLVDGPVVRSTPVDGLAIVTWPAELGPAARVVAHFADGTSNAIPA